MSNPRVARDRYLLFRAIARTLLTRSSRPIVVVDWTELTGGFHALVAAVPAFGRALPIYVEVHPAHLENNSEIEQGFLRKLSWIVPVGCRPIIVTDAGFRGPFFRAIVANGWDFLGRLRGMVSAQLPDGHVAHREELCAKPGRSARDFGEVTLYPNSNRLGRVHPTRPTPARLVLAPARPAHRRKRLYPKPTSRAQRSAIRGAREPWLLATSLKDVPARTIVKTYAKRMPIEETFRDTKNHRWGWSLRHVRCRSVSRFATLLLVAVLGIWVVTFFGADAELRNLHRSFQANTLRRRVLSLFALGLAVARYRRRHRIRWHTTLHALRAGHS